MKETQKLQSDMLTMLLHQQLHRVPETFGSPSSVPSLDEAVALLVRAYEATETYERPTKFRKIAASFPAGDRAVLSDIGRILTDIRSEPIKTEIPPPSRTSEPQPNNYSMVSQYPFFDLGSVGVDVGALDGEALVLLNDSLCGWLQANDCA